MALGNLGNINSLDFAKLASILLNAEDEENELTEEEKLSKVSDESIFAKNEIGGNGQSELKTKDDVDNALKELSTVIAANSAAEYADVMKAENKLNAQKEKIDTEQTEKKNTLFRQFIDALTPGKEISAAIKSDIKELHDVNLQKELLQQYDIFKKAEEEGEVAKPTIDLMQ